ncbi:MAG: hypothetical protein ACRDYA_05490 [Egibacteraceae bacterium]
MIIVRQRDVAVHDETWIAQVDALASAAQGWTGNDTQVLELSEDKVATALQRSNAIIRELRGGAIRLHGPPPAARCLPESRRLVPFAATTGVHARGQDHGQAVEMLRAASFRRSPSGAVAPPVARPEAPPITACSS